MARQLEKQLRGLEEHLVCDVCGRTMLKGERTEPYLAPSRERKLVCQLCAQRAQKEGWIKEAADQTPVQPPRPSERGRFLRRRRRRPAALGDAAQSEPAPRTESETSANGLRRRARPRGDAPRSRDPRHVRAVPTSVDLKIERAIQLFNRSDHTRTVAGIGRTLGPPRVSASTSDSSPAEVMLTVAWELSWYQYSIDLSDTSTPVREHRRGHEIEELSDEAREWNAVADDVGRIAIGEPETDGDERPAADSDGEPVEDDL
jgi:hypothetical protein